VLNRNTAKLTPEQIRENARIKKQKQREAQKEKVENIVAKKTMTIEEKREKERLKKQKQRDAQKESGIKKEITDEMREKERLKKQKQREAKKLKNEQQSE
jgi:hypothetical protein